MRRSKFERITTLLDAVQICKGLPVTRVLNRANLCYKIAHELLDYFESIGFIRKETLRGRIITTYVLEQKGYIWLKKAKELLQEVGIDAYDS